ncbi:MAG: ABC transporter permease [Candidatus Zipacnadales bacterium]
MRIIAEKAAPAVGLVLLYVFFAWVTNSITASGGWWRIWEWRLREGSFLSPDNQIFVALQIAVVALLAIGETFVIVSGGIDLSVGSVLALSGVVTALLLSEKYPFQLPVGVGIAAGIGVGTLCGLINGLLVTWAKLPPFIVTLGMMGVCRGFAKIPTDGQAIGSLPPGFTHLGSDRILGGLLPIPVLVLLAVAATSLFMLRLTAFGRYCYAMGSNLEAARLSGVNVRRYMTIVFVICGSLAGLAGVVQTARLTIGQPTGGIAYELDGIAAAVIGGASLRGGIGTISGTMLGAFIMAVLRNGCDLKNVSAHWQDVAIGGAIVLAVLVDRFRQR